GLQGQRLYTTYANLGTSLFNAGRRDILAGHTGARAKLQEGLGFIQRAIEVNPKAHFGREIWQVKFATLTLAASENPQLLLEHDLIGNPLDETIDIRNADSLDRDALLRKPGPRVLRSPEAQLTPARRDAL